MAALNTQTSVVDLLKSQGKDSSLSARANLAVQYGYTKTPQEYIDLANKGLNADINTKLMTSLRTPAQPVSPLPAAPITPTSPTNFINGNQAGDVAAGRASDAPPVRGATPPAPPAALTGSDIVQLFQQATGKQSIIPAAGAPDAPNFSESYDLLRTQHGIGGLETRLNDLQAEEDAIVAQKRERTTAERGKAVPMNVIEGRVGEVERQESERLDYVARQKSAISRELATANNVIENIMNLKKADYDTAKSAYDTEFNQNVSMFNMIKGVAEYGQTQEERVADNARANAQIIYNNLKDSGQSLTSLTPATQNEIRKLELQAGLPSGFFTAIAAAKPEGKILSTTTRESNGTKYADVVYQNKDGSLSTKTVTIGKTDLAAGDKDSDSELERAARTKVTTFFGSVQTDGGKVPVANYVAARKAWVSDVKGATAKSFDDIYARDFLDANDYEAAGVSFY